MTIELSQQEKKAFELKDLKDLLKKLENSTATEEDFKKLDENDSDFNDAEKKLYEKRDESKEIIDFIKGIIQNRENAENTIISKTINKVKNTINKTKIKIIEKKQKAKELKKKVSKNIKNIKEKGEKAAKIVKEIFDSRKETTNIKDSIKKINDNKSITKEEKQEKLKEKEEKLKEIKGTIENKSTQNKELKKEISKTKTETKIIKTEFTGLENNIIEDKETIDIAIEEIGNIANKAALNGNKLVEEETTNVVKEAIAVQDEIKEVEETHKEIKDDSTKTENITEETENVQELNQDEIEKTQDEIEKTEEEINKSINEITNSLSFGSNNNIKDTDYIKDITKLIKITDKKKLLRILKQIEPDELKKIHFRNFNHEIKQDYNAAIDFFNLTKNKLNGLDIKDLDLTQYNKEDLISLFMIINDDAFKNYIIQNINNEDKEILIKSITNSNQLNKTQKDQLLKNIGDALNYLGNNKDIFENYTYDINKIKKINENNKKDLNNLNPLEKELFNMLQSYGKTNYLAIDNYFQNKIENSPTKFLKLLGKQSGLMVTKLPKTMNVIKKHSKILTSFLEENPSIYEYIPERIKIKGENSINYLNSLFNKNSKVSLEQISKVRIKDIGQAKEIIKILKDKKIKISELLKYPEMRNTIIDFIDINKTNIQNLSGENKTFFNEFFSLVNQYEEEMKNYKNTYNNNVKNRKIELNKSGEIDKLNKNPDKINNYISKNATKIEENFKKSDIYKKLKEKEKPFALSLLTQSSYEAITGKNDGNIDYFISELAELGITDSEFKEIMSLRETIIKEENKNHGNKLGKMKPKLDNDKNLLKDELKEDGSLDEYKIKNNFNKFLFEKTDIKNEKGETLKYGTDNWKKEVLKQYGEKYSKLEDAEIKKQINLVLNGVLEEHKAKQQAENSDALLEAHRTGDFRKYNKLAEKGFYNEVDKSIKEYEEVQLKKQEQTKKLENTNYTLNNENGSVLVTDKLGNESTMILSKEDKILIKYNPELIDNIVDFYITLKDLGFTHLWEFKDKIFISLGEKFGTAGFNTTGDYIDKKELVKFLNSILQSVGKKTIEINSISLEGFKTKFKEKNNLQENGKMANDLNKKGDSSIEEIFLEKFVNNKSGFQIGEFKEAIKNNNNSNENTTK